MKDLQNVYYVRRREEPPSQLPNEKFRGLHFLEATRFRWLKKNYNQKAPVAEVQLFANNLKNESSGVSGRTSVSAVGLNDAMLLTRLVTRMAVLSSIIVISSMLTIVVLIVSVGFDSGLIINLWLCLDATINVVCIRSFVFCFCG